MRILFLCHNLRFAGGLSVGKNVVATLRRVADEHEFLLVMPAGAGYESIELPGGAGLVRSVHTRAAGPGVAA
jgi:hypothetical protein